MYTGVYIYAQYSHKVNELTSEMGKNIVTISLFYAFFIGKDGKTRNF